MPHAICWPPPERLVQFGRVDAVQPHKPDNPYQAWIDMPMRPSAGVKKVIALSDRIAAATTPAVRDQMHQAFRAAQLEWMFWDSAYRGEAWPV